MAEAETSTQLWLNMLSTTKGLYLHKANIVLGAILNGSNAVTGVYQQGGYSSFIESKIIFGINVAEDVLEAIGSFGLTSIPSVKNAIVQEINAIADELKNPNIDGVPIHATQEVEASDITVAKKVMIDEVGSNKLQLMDNAVPQLRTWKIRGHIASSPITDDGLIIKPSLIAQRAILQAYADARRPVLFKTHDNRFFKVLIEHFETGYNVNYLNALDVSIDLVEFRALSINTQQGAVLSGNKK